LFGLLVFFLINCPYYSPCCPGSAYGDHHPENLSQSENISPYALMMGIATAASSIFTSHIFHPSNELVVGPGSNCFIYYEGRCPNNTYHIAGVDGDYNCSSAIDAINSSGQNQSD
jgi:hypothetical protein